MAPASIHDVKRETSADLVEAAGPCEETAIQQSPSGTREDKHLVRKIDWHVLPWLCILYALSLIDRVNISAAKIVGMEVDLDLTGNRYNIALLVFFITYILTEIPSNAFIKKVGSRHYLTFLVVGWGTIAMCFAFVKTFGQLVALRVLLGLFEGGFNPACIFIISSWYKRYEVQRRLAIWFVFGSAVSGFTGIISYGLSQLEGKGGLRGWQWIFLIPGALTIAMAIPIFFYVADFPEKARWLNPHELTAVKDRIMADRGEALEEEVSRKETLRQAVTDWKVHAMALLLLLPTAGSYSLSFFAPSILSSFGFNVALSQILTTPPYLAGAVISVITGIVADRVRLRSPFIVFHSLLTIVGIALVGWGGTQRPRYLGLFLAVAGNNCAIPSALAFLSNNVVGVGKRQFAVPIQTIYGGIGGVVGALLFRQQDYPGYRPGLYASFACILLNAVLAAFMAWHFFIQNRRADRDGKVLEGLPGFRYTI